MKNPLARFVLATLAWLPATFALWYLAAPILLTPVLWLVSAVTRFGFGDLVREVAMESSTFAFTTSLRPGQTVSGGLVSVDVNPLLYAFGLPMYAALVLAAHERNWPRRLLIGYAALLPFIAWGVLADFLKSIGIAASPLIVSQAGFSAVQREAIAFAYQFGALIMPTVAPAVLWVLLHRPFLERLRGEGATSGG